MLNQGAEWDAFTLTVDKTDAKNIQNRLLRLCVFCDLPNGKWWPGLQHRAKYRTACGPCRGSVLFYIELTFTDGSGVGDANNTVTMSNINFGGGSALGCPLIFGGAGDSLETSVTITDGSNNSLFSEQFAPGLLLSFSLMLTSNDDAGGALDGFTLFLLDSSGVPLPTMAPFGDYLLGADLSSTGPNFNVYGIDPNRPLTGGNAVFDCCSNHNFEFCAGAIDDISSW